MKANSLLREQVPQVLGRMEPGAVLRDKNIDGLFRMLHALAERPSNNIDDTTATGAVTSPTPPTSTSTTSSQSSTDNKDKDSKDSKTSAKSLITSTVGSFSVPSAPSSSTTATAATTQTGATTSTGPSAVYDSSTVASLISCYQLVNAIICEGYGDDWYESPNGIGGHIYQSGGTTLGIRRIPQRHVVPLVYCDELLQSSSTVISVVCTALSRLRQSHHKIGHGHHHNGERQRLVRIYVQLLSSCMTTIWLILERTSRSNVTELRHVDLPNALLRLHQLIASQPWYLRDFWSVGEPSNIPSPSSSSSVVPTDTVRRLRSTLIRSYALYISNGWGATPLLSTLFTKTLLRPQSLVGTLHLLCQLLPSPVADRVVYPMYMNGHIQQSLSSSVRTRWSDIISKLMTDASLVNTLQSYIRTSIPGIVEPLVSLSIRLVELNDDVGISLLEPLVEQTRALATSTHLRLMRSGTINPAGSSGNDDGTLQLIRLLRYLSSLCKNAACQVLLNDLGAASCLRPLLSLSYPLPSMTPSSKSKASPKSGNINDSDNITLENQAICLHVLSLEIMRSCCDISFGHGIADSNDRESLSQYLVDHSMSEDDVRELLPEVIRAAHLPQPVIHLMAFRVLITLAQTPLGAQCIMQVITGDDNTSATTPVLSSLALRLSSLITASPPTSSKGYEVVVLYVLLLRLLATGGIDVANGIKHEEKDDDNRDDIWRGVSSLRQAIRWHENGNNDNNGLMILYTQLQKMASKDKSNALSMILTDISTIIDVLSSSLSSSSSLSPANSGQFRSVFPAPSLIDRHYRSIDTLISSQSWIQSQSLSLTTIGQCYPLVPISLPVSLSLYNSDILHQNNNILSRTLE
jgi:hypothetical protein